MTIETRQVTRHVVTGTDDAPFIQAIVRPDATAAVHLRPTSVESPYRLIVATAADAAEWADLFTALHHRMKDAEVANALLQEQSRNERRAMIDQVLNPAKGAKTK